jgi:hypothetical protein
MASPHLAGAEDDGQGGDSIGGQARSVIEVGEQIERDPVVDEVLAESGDGEPEALTRVHGRTLPIGNLRGNRSGGPGGTAAGAGRRGAVALGLGVGLGVGDGVARAHEVMTSTPRASAISSMSVRPAPDVSESTPGLGRAPPATFRRHSSREDDSDGTGGHRGAHQHDAVRSAENPTAARRCRDHRRRSRPRSAGCTRSALQNSRPPLSEGTPSRASSVSRRSTRRRSRGGETPRQQVVAQSHLVDGTRPRVPRHGRPSRARPLHRLSARYIVGTHAPDASRNGAKQVSPLPGLGSSKPQVLS